MKVDKYKYLGNSKYKVNINNNDYILYEDIILKYNLLIKEDVKKEELSKYINENKKYDAYYIALKYIKTKLRTKKEIRDYLCKKDYEDLCIDYAIARLENEKYLDERLYIKSYIQDAINLKNIGPNNIMINLVNLGCNKDIVFEELSVFNEDIINEKISKYIDKSIKTNHNKSNYVLKNKIKQNLINLGYNLDQINIVLNDYDIDDSMIYQKELDNIKKKLSKKYEGKQLEYKIKEYMYRKGFRVE